MSVTLTCAYPPCGAPYRAFPYEVARGRKFCSDACRRAANAVSPPVTRDATGRFRAVASPTPRRRNALHAFSTTSAEQRDRALAGSKTIRDAATRAKIRALAHVCYAESLARHSQED